MQYFISLASILLLLALIVGCCVVFTNAIEHLGKALKLADGAVGCILAAIGTALPETIVPLVAIFGAYFTGESIKTGSDIGIGAILGSPFLLTTLAMLVTGLAILLFTKLGTRSDSKIEIDTDFVRRDLRYFVTAYTVGIMATLLPNGILKYITGVLLLAYYLVYVFRTIAKCTNGSCDAEIDELLFSKILKLPESFNIALIWLQIIVSIGALILFSHLFVENIKFLSEQLRLSPLIVSLLLSPVATELPEMFNSVIWVRQKKDTLALANITGAIVFQSCIPMSIGIFFTPWQFPSEALINIVIVYIAVMILYVSIIVFKKKIYPQILIASGMLYVLFICFVIFKKFLP